MHVKWWKEVNRTSWFWNSRLCYTNLGPKTFFFLTQIAQKSNLGKLYHMTHHFSCSGREKIEKNIFRSFWPNWAPNLGQKGSFWVKIFKKMKIFQKIFFSIWMILSRKKAKKRMKNFFPYQIGLTLSHFRPKYKNFRVWRILKVLKGLKVFDDYGCSLHRLSLSSW